jgi:predicted TPR repeat methyltransferase
MTNEGNSEGWLYHGGTNTADVAEHYDTWAETYDDDIRSWSYTAPEVVSEIVVTRMPDAASILDAGCGTGLVGHALRAAGFLGEIHGIDLSEESLHVAERTGAYTRLEPADLQQPLAAADNSVDALVCVGVMTYVPDADAAWHEFARVVRPGGLVVVTQREDLWESRDCQGVIDLLSGEGVWTPLAVTGPESYLPGNTEGMGPVGVHYVTAQVS